MLVRQGQNVLIFNQTGRALGPLGKIAEFLSVRGGNHLAEIALQAGGLSIDAIAHIAIHQQAEHFAFNEELSGFIPHQRVLDLPCFDQSGH